MKQYTYKNFLLGNIIIHVDDPEKAFLILKKCYPESHPVAHEIWAYLIPNDLIGFYGQNFLNAKGQDSLEIINASQISLEEHVDNRKIIGYICPMDLYDGNLKKGVVVYKITNQEVTAYGENEYLIVPAEIAETWEPVYEEQKKQQGPKQLFTRQEVVEFVQYCKLLHGYGTPTETLLDFFIRHK